MCSHKNNYKKGPLYFDDLRFLFKCHKLFVKKTNKQQSLGKICDHRSIVFDYRTKKFDNFQTYNLTISYNYE